MRINEIASAEDQMALWRLVSDSVWQAIETQRQQQAEADRIREALKAAGIVLEDGPSGASWRRE